MDASRLARYWSPVTRHEFGFTYIGLLMAIALMGAALAGTGMVWHTESRRLKERELLFVGEQYRRAIASYYERSPGTKKFPRSVDELLRDPRYPNVQRHLRKAYADPVAGSREWGLVAGPEGGITGVHSLSEEMPIRQANFAAGQADFEGRERYSDWRFVYVPPAAPVSGEATGR
jgi:type II secretory pathway pseudopilin PulG